MAQSARTVRSLWSARQLIQALIGPLERIPLSVHQLLFRLAIASVFLPAGFLKASSWESTVALFQDEYKVPLLAQIATIQLFVYSQAWHEHLVWGSILMFLMTRGAGAVSLDHLVRGWLKRRRT